MTDKKQDDQTMDSEHKSISDAFKRLNQADDLQPTVDMDAMILQQATDAIEASAATTSSTSTSDFEDLTFRRNRIIEMEQRMKKKSLLPVWAMPMGLAATVLLSFGVVTRVLQSPEFQELGSQPPSESVYDDSMIVSSENTGIKQKVKALTAEEEQEKDKEATLEAVRELQKEYGITLTHPDIEGESLDETIPNEQWLNYIDNELEQKQELAKKKSDYVTNQPPMLVSPEVVVNSVPKIRSESSDTVVVMRSEQEDSGSSGFSVGGAAVAEEGLRQNVEPPPKDIEETLMTKPSREVTLAAQKMDTPLPEISTKSKNENLFVSQADKDISYQAVEEIIVAEQVLPESIVVEQEVPVAELNEMTDSEPSTEEFLSAEPEAKEIPNEYKGQDLIEIEPDPIAMDPPVSDDSIQEVIVTGARRQDDSSLSEYELPEDELEEIVVTGTRLNDGSETEQDLLTELVFEHRQCQVNYDCALVALKCDSCDCLETVNLQNLDKYDSEFSVTEIKEQCLNQTAECVLGYCQAREIEGLPE